MSSVRPPSAATPASRLMALAKLGFDLTRDLRTVALWLLGPLDLLVRRIGGRGDLPPLWLRRHAGPARDFQTAARDMEATLRQLGVVRETDQILEIGCGCGAMVPAFLRMLGPDGRYMGFDVHAPSIRWCQRRFAADARFRFELAEISSPYGDASYRRPVEAYRFPAEDAGADFILAKSVFTHLLEENVRHYLREIRRVLRPGSRALVTAFLFDAAVRPAAFPFPKSDSRMRWLRPLRIQAAVAFDRAFFESMISDAGLSQQSMIPGYWPGTSPIPTGQDVLILGVTQ